MYLPTEEPAERAAITKSFMAYRRRCEQALWGEYAAVEHWAKVETEDVATLPALRARLASRFGQGTIDEFNAARRRCADQRCRRTPAQRPADGADRYLTHRCLVLKAPVSGCCSG